jgi:hypothetical protein
LLAYLPAQGGFCPERIKFVLGAAGFLLPCLPSLFDFGTIRPWQLHFARSNLLKINNINNNNNNNYNNNNKYKASYQTDIEVAQACCYPLMCSSYMLPEVVVQRTW